MEIIICCGNRLSEYISQRQPLGGLLFLLPQTFSFGNEDDKGSNRQDHGHYQMKNVIAELEQLLIHSNIPVSRSHFNFSLAWHLFLMVLVS